MNRTLRALACGVGLTCITAGCGGMTLYDVTRAPVEDCDITPSGEFCSEGGAPLQEKLVVELRDDDYTVVYFGDEAWVAAGVDGPRQVVKEEKATRLPGPCTSTLRRELSFEIADDLAGAGLTGSYQESTRVEGPDACGETPRGTRVRYTLTGTVSSSI